MGFYSYNRSSYKKKDVKCNKCGGKHKTSKCSTSCYNCGGAHYVTNCPRRRSSSSEAGSARKKAKKLGWEAMKVPELKEACRNRGLPRSGLKADLVARLKKFVKEGGSSQTQLCPVAASVPAPAGVKDDVYAMFDVEDDTDDAAMLEAVSNFELSQSSDGDSKPAASCEPTEEQRERMRRNLEVARNKKIARLSVSSTASIGTQSMDTSMSQSPIESQGKGENRTPTQSLPKKSTPTKPAVNPYLQKPSNLKRDERTREEMKIIREGEDMNKKALSDMLPLPDDAPPVREVTSKKLSEEQLDVIMAARPPRSSRGAIDKKKDDQMIGEHICVNNYEPSQLDEHDMVRVNAAAGTGKTTTLVHLATRCIDLGHTSLMYVTYTRASANDAKDRMQAQLDEDHKACIKASTLHSCAMGLLSNEPMDGQEVEDKRLFDDNAFENIIREHWGKAIENYLDEALKHVVATMDKKNPPTEYELARKQKLMYDKALYYIMKTLDNFTRKGTSLETLKDEKNKGRHYYPFIVGDQFKEGGPNSKLGFPPSYGFEPSYKFYADSCVEIWEYAVKNGIRTFNIEMKKAQLAKLRIPCSVLLVDECQDLDGCQVAWIECQKKFGTHIFLVGDSAQCIYGFRGAKSSYVMGLDCIDTALTKSWRFGPNIAKLANIPLFVKEMSPQTTSSKRLWIPYRVTGARKDEESSNNDSHSVNAGGVITTKSLLEDWQKYKPLTLIGRTNAGIMIKAMDLLGLSGLKNPNNEEDESTDAAVQEGSYSSDELLASSGSPMVDLDNLPKFHINGKGEASGLRKWSSALRRVRLLYELYMNKDESGCYLPMSLPASDFKPFADEGDMTWETFINICNVREIKAYHTEVNIIYTYEKNTPKAMDAFEAHVLGEKYSEEEADIILTTSHSAKGLEWNHIEICDDLLDLSEVSVNDTLPARVRHPSFLKLMPNQIKSEEASQSSTLDISEGEKRKGWQFQLSSYRDEDINCLYVALTRGRKTLSVPSSILALFKDFDTIHYLVDTFEKDATGADETMLINGEKKRKLNKSEVWNLYYDLVHPLRRELGVEDGCILSSLFPSYDDAPTKVKAEEDQGEEHGYQAEKFQLELAKSEKQMHVTSTAPGDGHGNVSEKLFGV